MDGLGPNAWIVCWSMCQLISWMHRYLEGGSNGTSIKRYVDFRNWAIYWRTCWWADWTFDKLTNVCKPAGQLCTSWYITINKIDTASAQSVGKIRPRMLTDAGNSLISPELLTQSSAGCLNLWVKRCRLFLMKSCISSFWPWPCGRTRCWNAWCVAWCRCSTSPRTVVCWPWWQRAASTTRPSCTTCVAWATSPLSNSSSASSRKTYRETPRFQVDFFCVLGFGFPVLWGKNYRLKNLLVCCFVLVFFVFVFLANTYTNWRKWTSAFYLFVNVCQD